MITLYTLPSSTSSRTARNNLIQSGRPFVIHNMKLQPLTFDELKNILHFTERGVEDILANGKIRKEIEAEGVDFEEITLSELHYYITRFPALMRAPICMDKDRLIIGYDEERYRVYTPKHLREREFNIKLDILREDENRRLQQNERIAAGHWG
jgi:regulatory protein spx